MSLVKYRVKEVAADFGMQPKEIAEIVGKYFEKPKSNTQVLTEEELKMVHKRMAQMGTTNREAYMRKMALDGYILRLEIPELKEYVAMQRVHSKRFNEIAKRVNETGHLYPEDVAEMKEMISKSTAQMELVLAEVNKLK